MEFHHSLDTFPKHIQRKILIRRMNSVTLQTESHQNSLCSQNLFKITYDRDTATTAHSQRLSPKRLGETFFRSFVSRQGYRTNIAFATVHRSHFHLHVVRSYGLDIIDKHPGNLLMLLMGNQTARHFGISEDRAVNYHSDGKGTQLNYEVLSEAICSVRCSAPLGADWKKRIDEDYEARKEGRRK